MRAPAVEGSRPLADVRDFGARGDGRALDTAPIQAAIEACAARGGGTVFLAAGTWLSGALFLRSFVTLALDAGAVLLGSEDPADYPVIESRWEGETRAVHAPLIGGKGLQRIAVMGRGVVDGQGAAWWRRHREKNLAHPRPRLISFVECSEVLIEGITAVRSPSWTINPVRCRDVVVEGVTIRNPPDSPNTDGINPDSCSRVRIANCLVSVGDDCITLKSGTEREHPDLRAPCSDIAITNCILEAGHGAVVIGSEMSGHVRNVVVSNCIINGTDRGIRLKSRRGRGGVVENVRVSNLIMNDVQCPFTMNMYYGWGAWGDAVVSDKGERPVDEGTPRFRSIAFSNVTARGVRFAAAFIYGLAEAPVEDVRLTDVSVTLSAGAEEGYAEMADGFAPVSREGLFVRYARGLTLDHVRIEGQRGSAFHIEDSQEIELHCCTSRSQPATAQLVHLARCTMSGDQGRRQAEG